MNASENITYEEGFDDGYQSGCTETAEAYEQQLSDLEKQMVETTEDLCSEHERILEKEIKSAISLEEDKHDIIIKDIQYNMENIINNFNQVIRQLREENYNLRKEYAATTRSLSKSLTNWNT